MAILFKTKKKTITAQFNTTKTAHMIIDTLPITSSVQRWGEEIYFQIPVQTPGEQLTTDVAIGDIAYWPEGNCLCIFFGKTPVSTDEKPMPASAVSIVGTVTGDTEILKSITSGDEITVMQEGT